MEAATNIADQFLEAGKLIVYTEGKARPRFDVYSTARGLCNNDEVVILIDELSASASEILAGAIQDNDRGTIIGRRSFGKGLVQEQIEFRDGSALRLTIARYYTPTGRSIQKPYNGNHSDYYHDLNERFVKGEFESRDSIKFADSLRYVTPGGKTVYGGGGIMPDVFVPIDTANVTGYFNTVRNLGLIYRFAFDYTDTNRARLETLKTAEEIDQYLNKSGYFNEFVNYAEFRGVKADWGEIAISRDIIATQLKAYIARNLIDNEGFFPIIRKIDSTLEKAVELISEK
jgi:carboxyl-terminal processing protease